MSVFKDRYCFIHLPKSAGTSLLRFLRAQSETRMSFTSYSRCARERVDGRVSVDKLPGVQDSLWIERLFKTLMESARD